MIKKQGGLSFFLFLFESFSRKVKISKTTKTIVCTLTRITSVALYPPPIFKIEIQVKFGFFPLANLYRLGTIRASS